MHFEPSYRALLLGILGVVNGVRKSTLQLLRNRLLDPEWHLAIRTSILRMCLVPGLLFGSLNATGTGVVDLDASQSKSEQE